VASSAPTVEWDRLDSDTTATREKDSVLTGSKVAS